MATLLLYHFGIVHANQDMHCTKARVGTALSHRAIWSILIALVLINILNALADTMIMVVRHSRARHERFQDSLRTTGPASESPG